MRLHPEANTQVLHSLAVPHSFALAGPDDKPDPYYGCGCHPEVVERVWDQIGAAYPKEARCLVYGRPAIVDPTTGIIVAVGYGTAYCVRIPVGAVADATKLGAEVTTKWTGGSQTNIEEEFGQGWVFGAWLEQETAWSKEASAGWMGSSDGSQT